MQKTIVGIGLMVLMGFAAYFFYGTLQKEAAQEAVPQLERVQGKAREIERTQDEAIRKIEQAMEQR